MSALCEIWTITSIAYERCRAISTPLTRAKRLGHTKVGGNILFAHCLKITQNVAFEFLNFGIFHQFLSF